jgi:hypothetical protein
VVICRRSPGQILCYNKQSRIFKTESTRLPYLTNGSHQYWGVFSLLRDQRKGTKIDFINVDNLRDSDSIIQILTTLNMSKTLRLIDTE